MLPDMMIFKNHIFGNTFDCIIHKSDMEKLCDIVVYLLQEI